MSKMTAAGYIAAVEKHCNALHPKEDTDYKKDGLLHCGKCNTPLECVNVSRWDEMYRNNVGLLLHRAVGTEKRL